jgi:hypothetical protein
MLPLYKLADQYNQVWEMVTDDDADLQTLQDTLESIECAVEIKAHNAAALVRTLESSADQIDLEIKRLQGRKKALENRADSIKAYIKTQLEAMGLDKVKTPAFTVAIQNNPPSVVVNDPALVPAAFQIVKYDLDKKAISAALKAGEQVPGCELAIGKSLRIR